MLSQWSNLKTALIQNFLLVWIFCKHFRFLTITFKLCELFTHTVSVHLWQIPCPDRYPTVPFLCKFSSLQEAPCREETLHLRFGSCKRPSIFLSWGNLWNFSPSSFFPTPLHVTLTVRPSCHRQYCNIEIQLRLKLWSNLVPLILVICKYSARWPLTHRLVISWQSHRYKLVTVEGKC